MFGLDYVTAPSIAAMQSAHVAFVCRYLSEVNDATKVKLLTPAEAKADSEAGIALVSNYEWYGNRAAEGFASGVYDAKIAAAQHTACGGAPDRPIYFSVDFDTGTTSAIIDYFKGVASVIGLARTGAYGGYACIKGLLDAKAISWAWQTYAWSAGAWDARAHIRQYQNGVTFDGRSVDYDEAMMADYGQWFYGGGSMVPTGWKDDGTTLTAPNGNKVTMGFREHILSKPGGWDAGDQPLSEEFHADPLEYSNPALGAGQKLCCTKTTLEWTQARGVFEAWQGQEIYALLALLAKDAPAPQPNITDAIAQLEAAQAAAGVIGSSLGKALTDLKQ